ncbi:MAG: rhomboid family intramembrane serine protease [Gemmatimonadota bacterium]
MTQWTGRLLVANALMYFLAGPGTLLSETLLLVPAGMFVRPWTVVTYMFLHGSFTHLFFNLLVLFFFGPRLEARLGGRSFITLYLISGLVAALFSLLTPFIRIVGASGAIYGVVLGYARFWPHDRIYIWAILPVEARWLVIGGTVLSLWGIFLLVSGAGAGGVAHHAHLGGFAGAYLYLRYREHTSPAAKFKKKVEGGTRKGRNYDRQAMERWSRIDPESLHEVNREALRAVMEKLSKEGIGSLSQREREFLDRFSPS